MSIEPQGGLVTCFNSKEQPISTLEAVKRFGLNPHRSSSQESGQNAGVSTFPLTENGKTIVLNFSEFTPAVLSHEKCPAGMNSKKSLLRFAGSYFGMSERQIASCLGEKQQTTHESLHSFKRFLGRSFHFDFGAVLPPPEFSSPGEEEIVNQCRDTGDWSLYEAYMAEVEQTESGVTNEG